MVGKMRRGAAAVAGELGWAPQVAARVQPRGGTHPKERFWLHRVLPGKLVRERDHPGPQEVTLCLGFYGVLTLTSSKTKADFTPAWL